jgi:hypothetical protein
LPLIGFHRERQRIAEAVRKHEPLLLLGPPGAGKTRLLRFALECASGTGVYLRFVSVFHNLLSSFARELIAGGHLPVRAMVVGLDPLRWCTRQTSVHLKGLIWRAVESAPRLVILDGVYDASAPVYRFFQRVYYTPGVTMFAAARDPVSLGALHKLFWDPRQTVCVPPLDDHGAASLFDSATERFGLHRLELGDFRTRTLECARGNPGQIVEMCRLAADPAYVSGRHILFAPLRIDVMARFLP